MKNILLCSQDPMLVKGLYGPLRDAGYTVETSEHPADAIKCVLNTPYLSVILDSRDIGIPAADAAAIIKTIRPETYIVVVGKNVSGGDLHMMIQPDAIDKLRELMNDISTLRRTTYL
ncbi:MAG TPA: hypothetical protein VF790_10825 [Dissulfurispiraceae bacterium]